MGELVQWISNINAAVSSFVWGPVMLFAFLAIGLYFSVKSNFFQITRLKLWISKTVISLFKNKNMRKSSDEKSISQFGAVSTALAATIGTGSVVGVATAITSGGAGAVFWMWVSSFFGMMTAYAENLLGIKYRYKNESGEWTGGGMVYIERGLGMKWLACLFSFFCIFSSLGIGNMTQANSIAYASNDIFGVKSSVTGAVLCLTVGITVLGGIKRISAFTEKFIPITAILYILGCVIVIFGNAKALPAVFKSIFSEAFSLRSATGGFFGSVMLSSMRFGISRGVFSNEAGLGTSVTIHCASNIKEPVEQGMWSIFEVFVDTMLVCTLTAVCILSSGCKPSDGLDPVRLTCSAFSTVLGDFGYYFVSVSIILFAFATLMSGSYLGEKSVEYLFGRRFSEYYRWIYIFAIFIGCCTRLDIIWSISDTFNGLLAIPNLFAISVLSPEVLQMTDNYLKVTSKYSARGEL